MLARALVALCLALTATPAFAGDVGQDASAALSQYQQRDQRLHDIGWRLVRGNAAYCAVTQPAIGLTLQDMAGFASPDAARRALGLGSDFAVETIATDSPAALAGLAPNLAVRGIAGEDPDLWPAADRLDWARLKRAHDLIDARLAETGTVELAFGDPQTRVIIVGVPVCPTRFELASDDRGAKAEGSRVVIGESFVGFDYSDELLAAAIAHELAHNLLRHRAWLDEHGRKRRNVRSTEREADRLIPWLLANAGFDPAAASRFMESWGPKHAGGLLRARTHDGWDERLEMIASEVSLVEARMGSSGAADWQRWFRREIDSSGAD